MLREMGCLVKKSSGGRGRIRLFCTETRPYNESMQQNRKKTTFPLPRNRLYVDAAGLLIAFLLTLARVADVTAPFGLSLLFAFEMCGLPAVFPLLGVLVGAFVGGAPMWGTMLGAALFVLAGNVYRRFVGGVPSTVRIILFALCELVTLPFLFAEPAETLAFGALSMLLSILGGLLMLQTLRLTTALGRRRVLTDLEQTMAAVALGVLMLGLEKASILGVSLPVILMIFLSMFAVFARGIGGIALGVLLSASLALYGAADAALVGCMAFVTVFGSIARGYGRVAIFGAYALGALLLRSYWMTGLHVINAQNMLLGGVLFLVVPLDRLRMAAGYLNEQALSRDNTARALRRMQGKTADEMQKTAKVCKEIAQMFETPAGVEPSVHALLQWTAHGAQRTCADCEARVLCWQEPQKMGETVFGLILRLDQGEQVFPKAPVDPQCRYFQAMIHSAYLAYNQALVQQAGQMQAMRQFAFVNRQLVGIGDVLDRFADRVKEDRWLDDALEGQLLPALEKNGIPAQSVDALYPNRHLLLRIAVDAGTDTAGKDVLRVVSRVLRRPMRLLSENSSEKTVFFEMEEAQTLRASMAVVSVPEEAETVSGDATGEFRLPCGRVLYALSDGMGSGEAARKESNAAIELLFQLTRIGFSRDLIFENVNRMLLTRRQTEMYATLDAVALDLFTGDMELCKYGAPPSYLLRGSRIHKLACEALPCGIVDEAKPSAIHMKLKRNDLLVLCSDGVSDVLGEDIEGVLAARIELGSGQIAQQLLDAAKERGQRDDMTVMVIRVA